MKYTIQHRRGTTSQWNAANPVLAFAEVGVENTGAGLRSKIGDGITAWMNLPYADDKAIAAAATALGNATEYADDGDTATLTAAKSYSDAGDTGTLASAKSYTDTKTAGLPALMFDSGRRLIPLENGWTCYQAVLNRQGSNVSLYVRNMTGAAATSDTFLTMPAGFRDNAVNGAAQPVAGLYPYKTGGTPLTLLSVYSGALQTPSRGTDLQLLRSWITADPIPTNLPGTPA